MSRAHYLPINQFTLLDHACMAVMAAFDHPPYHVGSSTQRPDWRDVDVRLMLPDEEYDALFAEKLPEFWSLICLAITEYLSRVSGLPVDFQIQRMTDANREYRGHFRNPLGLTPPRLYAGGPAEETQR